MTMTPMQSALDRAAKALGLQVELGRTVTLADGSVIESQALFPDLGAPRGTLVFDSTPSPSVRSALDKEGFALSTFGQPSPEEEFDIASYEAMFTDWGWSGDEKDRPGWLREAAPD